MKNPKNTSTILCILDGFGLAPASINNVISEAFRQKKIRHIPQLFNYPWVTLDADGESVGQEYGLVGNSEVGHMNIGGLSLIPQLSYEITQSSCSAFQPTQLPRNQLATPKHIFQSCTTSTSTIHLIGLFSTGTIHSDLRHWIGAIEAALDNSFDSIVLHLFSDGRDSDKKSLLETWKLFESQLHTKTNNINSSDVTKRISLGSIAGRFYGMDRDTNWDRTEKALQAIFKNQLMRTSFEIIYQTIESLTLEEYNKGNFDENITPTSFGQGIEKNDVMWFVNFRTDRAKQIMKKLVETHTGLILGMNSYEIDCEHEIDVRTNSITLHKQSESAESNSIPIIQTKNYVPIFRTRPVQYPLARVLSELGKSQLHIAETEKYAHVTFFLNGGKDIRFKNEEWCLVPSHKVRSHTEKPEMRAEEITTAIINSLECHLDIKEIMTHEHDQLDIMNIALYSEVVHTLQNSPIDSISEPYKNINLNIIQSTYSRWAHNIDSSQENLTRKSCFIYNHGEIVGAVDYGIYYDLQELFVYNMYILPRHRKKGIASFALSYIENIAYAHQCVHVGMCCSAGNVAAYNLYFSHGYKQFQEKMMEWYDDNNQLVVTTQSQYLKKEIKSSNTLVKHHDVIIANYANPDMLGHTGDIEAAIRSMEVLDRELGRLIDSAKKGNHTLIITADHGNIEKVGKYIDSLGVDRTDTEHNSNNVPLIIISPHIQKILDPHNVTSNHSSHVLSQYAFDSIEHPDSIHTVVHSICSHASDNVLDVEDWLTEDQIPKAIFSLWHAGLIALYFASETME